MGGWRGRGVAWVRRSRPGVLGCWPTRSIQVGMLRQTNGLSTPELPWRICHDKYVNSRAGQSLLATLASDGNQASRGDRCPTTVHSAPLIVQLQVNYV